jgi:DNA-binding CsgD family transcriptional regulator
MAPHGSPRLEGRDHELELLVAAFAECRSHHVGRTLVVHGVAGVGTSLLVRQLQHELIRRGLDHQWWSGRCTRAAPIAYEPFARLLRAVPGDAGGWLAEAAAAGGDAAGVALLAGLARRIREAAEDTPLVIVVDDVDGADASTARIITAVASMLDDVAVLMVLVGRTSDGGSPPAGFELDRFQSNLVAEVVVNPLGPDDIDRIVRDVAPELDETSVAALVEASAGRPAVAIALATAGDTERTLTTLLSGLGATAALAVVAATLADGWISAAELNDALATDPAIWAELERRRIVVGSERPGAGPVPTSELWANAARRALGPALQPVAAAIAAYLTDHAPAATAAIAWESAGRADEASHSWERACLEAERDLAIETAAAAIRRAIDLGGDPALVRLGRRAGTLMLGAGDRIDADALAERLLPRLPRDDERGMIGTLMLRYRARSEAGLADADAHLDRALAIEVDPCPERVDALVVDSLRCVLSDPVGAAAQAQRALDAATAMDDPAALAAAAGAAGMAEAISGYLDQALEHFDTALAAAARAGNASIEARLASNRVYVLWRAGRPIDVERAATEELQRLRVRGLGALGDQLAVGRCSALLTLARLDDLDAAIIDARSLKLAADAAALLDAVEAELAIVRGELDRAGALVEQIRSSPAVGLPEVAADLWLAWSALDLARGQRHNARDRAVAGLRECGQADDIALLRLVLAWWQAADVGDSQPQELPHPRPVGAEGQALATTIAAFSSGSRQAWDAAIHAWDQVPAPLHSLRCQLATANATRDLDELDRIAEAARALGAYGLSGAADAAWRAAGGRRAAQRTDRLLTDREIEVLACVAEGLTNREVGDRLFISVRTVGAHLERCMSKLGVNTRGAAVHEARRQGLLTS